MLSGFAMPATRLGVKECIWRERLGQRTRYVDDERGIMLLAGRHCRQRLRLHWVLQVVGRRIYQVLCTRSKTIALPLHAADAALGRLPGKTSAEMVNYVAI